MFLCLICPFGLILLSSLNAGTQWWLMLWTKLVAQSSSQCVNGMKLCQISAQICQLFLMWKEFTSSNISTVIYSFISMRKPASLVWIFELYDDFRGVEDPATWAPGVGNSWRTTGDIWDSWNRYAKSQNTANWSVWHASQHAAQIDFVFCRYCDIFTPENMQQEKLALTLEKQQLHLFLMIITPDLSCWCAHLLQDGWNSWSQWPVGRICWARGLEW